MVSNLDTMIAQLKEWIQFNIAGDIVDLPDNRQEYQPYVNRCKDVVPKAAVPFVVLVMLTEESKSFKYKVCKFLRLVKK